MVGYIPTAMTPGNQAKPGPDVHAGPLRRIVLTVAILNLSYFFVEFSVALVAGSVSLLADSVDFLEDTAINLLIFIALGWPLARRAAMGKAMAVVILGPAAVAGWQAIERFSDPVAPDVVPVVLASIGAMAINGTSAWLLVKVRHHGGSLSRAGGRHDGANLRLLAGHLGHVRSRARGLRSSSARSSTRSQNTAVPCPGCPRSRGHNRPGREVAVAQRGVGE